ncbi:unnamed protein product, partial [marine sediment metagenome]
EYKNSLKRDKLSLEDRAYKYFFVNRTSVNGVGGFGCATGVVRRNMSKSVSDFLASIDNLPEIHQRLSRVIIENRDAIELIEKYDRDKVFFYLDPPYHHSTRTQTRYVVDMSAEQQEALIDCLLNIKKAKVLLSGYNCKNYDALCKKEWKRIDFKVKTQDGNRKGKIKIESLWLNYSFSDIGKKEGLFE